MASPSELSLDCKNHGVTQLDQNHKLEEFLARLEEERLKIDAFKRELPLCMQLLNNAMDAYRRQLESQQGQRSVQLEEFIPLKQPNTGKDHPSVNTSSEKPAWMATAQLWNNQETESARPEPGVDITQRTNTGAFLPFSKDRVKTTGSPDLTLSSAKEVEEMKRSETSALGRGPKVSTERGGEQAMVGEGAVAMANTLHTAHRKARRCWSPDLHRRFVNALQMLGGSQVATPKQIRELMKVDGLTNDEVKSHLQKYRLHTRRPIPAPQVAATGVPPQLVVLGGIWVPPEYAATASNAIYGAHQPQSVHYCTTGPVPQEFYTPSAHHRNLQPPPHAHRGSIMVYKGSKHFSPESQGKSGAGERSESIEDGEDRATADEEEEDGKSDEKVAASVRAVEDDNNDSGVTLKF